MLDGTCETCPDYEILLEGGKTCGMTTCNDRQKLLTSGVCVDCPDYQLTLPSDLKTCVYPSCTDGQKIMPDASCMECDDYTRATSDRKECAAAECSDR